jgi:antitoxin VapB
MAFSIKNDEADDLLRELCERTGESLTTAVIISLRERLERERLCTSSKRERIEAAVAAMRALPVINDVGVDDILQWDENGLPI